MQNPLQIIQERHRLALHLLALLHSFNPPPPSPWSCSSCPGPVGEGKGYLWRMLSLSSRLHHLLSMPSRAGKKTAYTRGVCMHAHTHGDKQAGGRMVTGCRRQREGEVGVLLFFQKKKKNLPGKCLVREPGSAAAGNSVAPVCCAASIHVSQPLPLPQSSFSSPFVLDDNDAQGGRKEHIARKKIRIRSAGSNTQC